MGRLIINNQFSIIFSYWLLLIEWKDEMMFRKMSMPIIQKEASIMDAVRTNENADANQDDNRNYPDILLTTWVPVF